MKLLDRLPKNTKKMAATAGGAFVLTNPLMATFLVGVGLALWFSMRRRRGY
jgi:hypothetical protein